MALPPPVTDWIKIREPKVKLNICDVRRGYKAVLETVEVSLKLGEPYKDYHASKKGKIVRAITYDAASLKATLNELGHWQIKNFHNVTIRKYGFNYVLPVIVWLDFEKDGRTAGGDTSAANTNKQYSDITHNYIAMMKVMVDMQKAG